MSKLIGRKQILLLELILFFLLLFGVTHAHGDAVYQANENDSFEIVDCATFEITELPDYRCGYVHVPEKHERPDGRSIQLAVVIYRPESVSNRDPIFIAQGGPGGSAIDTYGSLIESIGTTTKREVVLFDQRGTLYSNPNLLCDELFAIQLDLAVAEDIEQAEGQYNGAVKACHDRFEEEGVDLSAYNSVENAADVEMIREVLGYERYNFYGVSYGTMLGLHLIRDYPDRLRSVILDGVVPLHLNFIPEVATNTDRVLDAIFLACTENEQCVAQYPDLEARFFSLIDQLNEQPTTIKVRDPNSGQTIDYYLDGDILLDLSFQSFYLPEPYATFPKLVDSFENGDFSFLQGTIIPLIQFDRTMSEGMYWSVICAEDIDFDPTEVDSSTLPPQISSGIEDDLASYLEACVAWDVPLLPQFVDEPVVSELPILLLSGAFDPITPPHFAEAAEQYLPNSYHFVDPTGSHGVAWQTGCIDSIIEQFLGDPESRPNGVCLAEREADRFVPIESVIIPDWINQIFSGNERLSWLVGGLVGSLFLIMSGFIVWPVWKLVGLLFGGRVSPVGSGCLNTILALSGIPIIALCALVQWVTILFWDITMYEEIPMGITAVSALGAYSCFIIPVLLLLGFALVSWLRDSFNKGQLRQLGQILILAFGLLGFGFISLLLHFVFSTISGPMINISAIPSYGRWLFVWPYLLLMVGVGIVMVAIRLWQEGQSTVSQKVYYTILTVAVLVHIILLGLLDGFTVLFS